MANHKLSKHPISKIQQPVQPLPGKGGGELDRVLLEGLGSEAIALGHELADIQITAIQQGFDARYQAGVQSLLKKQAAEVEGDRQWGEQIASVVIEERRKTLIAIALKTSVLSSVSVVVALAVGMSVGQAALCVPVAGLAAVCTHRR